MKMSGEGPIRFLQGNDMTGHIDRANENHKAMYLLLRETCSARSVLSRPSHAMFNTGYVNNT